MRWSIWKSVLIGTMLIWSVGCTESSSSTRNNLDAGADVGEDGGGDADSGTDADAGSDADVDVDGGRDADVAPNCVEDMCGVCDDDPTNDCVQDCDGVWGGTAAVDQCGTCDDDPSNDCVQDCAGTWGGSATPDNCGTCDDDPSNDCVQDCAGTWGGSATTDACGTCDDDTANDCDCAGTPGGSATVDQCGTCDEDPANDCVQDCAGTWGGSATLDGCGTCDDDPSNDCVDDCNGVSGGPAELDMCGTCDDDPTNDCVQDCAGTWGGSAVVDQCGTCDDDSTNDCVQDCAGTWGGSAVVDQCRTCDDDSTNDCVQDCNGDWGGSAITDVCGRCVDGNTGKTACPTVELSPVADATVKAISADSNFGTSTSLEIEADTQSSKSHVFMRFDLSSLPANAVVQGVELQALAYDGFAWGGDGNVYTYFVSDDAWQETAITWNNRPAAEATRLGHWWIWYGYGQPTEQLGVNSSPALAAVVQREYDGDGMLSVELSSPGYQTDYRSREYSDATKRPKLVVGYLPSSTTTLEPNADAWVDSTATNHGSDQSLEIRRYEGRVIYTRFGLASLPAGAQIVEARLTMTAYDGFAYGGNGNVYTRLVADDSWTEAGINGTNKPAPEADNLGYWWLWYGYGTPTEQTGTFSTTMLRDAVQAEYDGDGEISLRSHSSGYNTSYRSTEYSDAAKRPQLELRYVTP